MLIVTLNFRFTVATLAPNSGLLGSSNEEAALVEQWSHFGETEIAAFVGIANALCKGYVTPYNKPVWRIYLIVSKVDSYRRLDPSKLQRPRSPQF